jgi:hypothetical protein
MPPIPDHAGKGFSRGGSPQRCCRRSAVHVEWIKLQHSAIREAMLADQLDVPFVRIRRF